MNFYIKNYEKAVQELAKYFAKRYFEKDYEMYWVADCIGDVLYINDRFFDMDEIVNFIKYDYSADNIFKYYDYRLDCHEKGKTHINIKHYLKLLK